MFPTDMAAQQQKLMDELTIIVERLTDVAALADRSLDLGRRHREYGVEPQHYVVLRDALLFALAEVMEVPLDDATSLAWRRAYNLIAEVMMHGASHGRQSSPAP